jgi:2-phospho-L-lactate guanylyltransferase
MIKPVVIIPLKPAAGALARLSGRLDLRQRRGLQRAMAHDVVAAVRKLRPVPELALLAEDPLSARRLAGRRGLVVEAAPGAGLNLHLACAIAVLGAHRPGATALVVAADIPQAQPRDIVRLVKAASEHDLVVVPDRHGRDANALAFKLDKPPAFVFGAGSCMNHLDNAQRAGLTACVLELPSFALDVDTPEDLDLVLAAPGAPRTHAFLAGRAGEADDRDPDDSDPDDDDGLQAAAE